jgi:hypothetical protein
MGLIKLMSVKPAELASKFKMRKTHVATFVDTSMACGVQMPPDLPRASSARRRSSTASWLSEDANSVKYTEVPRPKPLYKPPPFELHRSTLSDASSGTSPARKLGSRTSHARNSPPRKSNAGELGPRNGYGRNSPPRKSNAGELGSRISHARSSPPRKSNAGDLGFRNGRITQCHAICHVLIQVDGHVLILTHFHPNFRIFKFTFSKLILGFFCIGVLLQMLQRGTISKYKMHGTTLQRLF